MFHYFHRMTWKKLSILIGLILFEMATTHAQMMRVMTFNIRYDNPTDGPDAWPERKTEVAMFLNDREYAVIGLQEVLYAQLLFLDSALVDFDYVGVGREDGKRAGEFAPIFYRTNEFELLDQGTFWLSETPDVPSVGWDAALPRICTWCILKSKLLQTAVLIMNAHLDHLGLNARQQSALLMLEKMEILSKHGQIASVVMGDFNADFSEQSVRTLSSKMRSCFLSQHQNEPHVQPTAETTDGSGVQNVPATFNGFKTNDDGGKMIDHIFIHECEVLSCDVSEDVRTNGRHLSDHFAVTALLQIHMFRKK